MKTVVLHAGLGLAFIWNIVRVILTWAVFLSAFIGALLGLVDGAGLILGVILGVPLGLLIGGLAAWFTNFALDIISGIVGLILIAVYKVVPGQDPLQEQPRPLDDVPVWFS